MKAMLLLALPLLLTASLARAGDLHGCSECRQAYGTPAADRGDRIEHRWDAHGDRIDQRLDRRATRQEALGHYRRAERLDRLGDRIDARFDRIGARREARFDRRHG